MPQLTKQQTSNSNLPKGKHWAMLAFLAFVWGSSFILIKKGLVAYSYTQVADLRIFITMLALSPIIIARFRLFKKKHLVPTLVVAILGSGIPPYLFCAAQTQLDSSVVGILNSLTPLFTMLVGVLLFRMDYKWFKLAGVMMGLFGAAALIYLSAPPQSEGGYIYGLLVVIASLFYALSLNTIKRYCQNIEPILLTAIVYLILGPFAGLHLFFVEDIVNVTLTADGAYQSLFFITLLAVLGSAMATMLFFKLTQETNALFASTVTYLQPMVAIGWGLADGEAITFFYIGAMALILSGVYVTGK